MLLTVHGWLGCRQNPGDGGRGQGWAGGACKGLHSSILQSPACRLSILSQPMWVSQQEVCRTWTVCPLVALTAAVKSHMKTALGCGKSWGEIRKIKPWNRWCRFPTFTRTHAFEKYPEDIHWTIHDSYHWGKLFPPPFLLFLQWSNIAFVIREIGSI